MNPVSSSRISPSSKITAGFSYEKASSMLIRPIFLSLIWNLISLMLMDLSRKAIPASPIL